MRAIQAIDQVHVLPREGRKNDQMRSIQTIDQLEDHVRPGDGGRGWDGVIR